MAIGEFVAQFVATVLGVCAAFALNRYLEARERRAKGDV